MLNDSRLPKKIKFLEYFKDVPMQKFACMHIGIDETTAGRWKNEDADFADRIDDLRAKFVQKGLKQVKNMDWKLERMFKTEFAQRTELTGADGKDLPTPIFGGISTQTPPTTPKK